jgi:DNA-binding protein HU-beta
MTRQEIIDTLQTAADLPDKTTAGKALDAILESMTEELASGGSVLIRGFGSFHVKTVAERQGRDFKTNQPIHIPAYRTVKFEPGVELRQFVLAGKSEAYAESAQTRLDALRASLDEWGKRTEGLGAGARDYYNANIGRFRNSYEEARYKLTLLRGSSGRAWTELKQGIDGALKELRTAFQRAREKF